MSGNDDNTYIIIIIIAEDTRPHFCSKRAPPPGGDGSGGGGGRSASRRAVSRVRARVLAAPKINIGSTVVFLSDIFPPRFQFNFSARDVLAHRRLLAHRAKSLPREQLVADHRYITRTTARRRSGRIQSPVQYRVGGVRVFKYARENCPLLL